jgi:hypothetical protein
LDTLDDIICEIRRGTVTTVVTVGVAAGNQVKPCVDTFRNNIGARCSGRDGTRTGR